jgi:hypothetical protein
MNTKPVYRVYWDNGAHACGTFPQKYARYEDAKAAADSWAAEMNAHPESEDGYSAEVIEE